MKKTLLLTAAFFVMLFSSNLTKAADDQKGHFGVGISLGLPLETGYTYIGGIDFKYEYLIEENLYLTGRLGYNYIGGKSETIDLGNGNTFNFAYSGYQIPFLVGAKYFFDEKFFGTGELGFVSTTVKVNLLGISANASTSGLAASIGAGYKLSDNIDLGLQFASYDSFKQLLLRGGYTF